MRRILSIVAAMLIIGPAVAQLYGQAWNYTPWNQQGYSGLTIGGDRTIKLRQGSVIDSINSRGEFLWDQTCPGPVKDVRATTDGLTYACGTTGTAGYVRCFNAQGGVLWTYTFNPDATFSEELTSMRISGGDLWVVGNRKVIASGQSRPGVAYLRLNRLTGAMIYSRALFLRNSATAIETAVQLSGTASHNFILVSSHETATDYLGLLRLDPIAGGQTSSFVASGGLGSAMAVDSANQVYIAASGTVGLVKVNGGSAPTMAEVWRRAGNNHSVLISKGAIFTERREALDIRVEKVTSAGNVAPFWDVDFHPYPPIVAADSQGRVFLATVYSYYDETFEIFYWLTHLYALDGLTGDPVWDETLGDYTSEAKPTDMTVDAFGTVYVTLQHNPYGGLVAFYQLPAPKADAYDFPEGRITSVAAPGVMANDVYCDPAECSTTLESPPSQGTVIMHPGGGFEYTPVPGSVGPVTFEYRVTRGSLSGVGTVTLNLKRSVQLSLAKSQIAGQNAMLGTVSMSVTQATATTVAVADNSSLVTTPGSVTIPAGQLSKTFGIQVMPVNSTIQTQISATYNGFTQTQNLTLLPLIPTSIVLTPAIVVGGNSVSAKIVINGVAGSGGRVIAVVSGSPYAQVPSTVTVPAGQSSVQFTVTTTQPPIDILTKITASVTAGFKSTNFRINH